MSNELTLSEKERHKHVLNAANENIRRMDLELAPCGVVEATELCGILLGSYPHHSVPDVDVYTRAIVSVLAEVPKQAAASAINEVTRSCKYMPTRAEVFAACQAAIGPLKAEKDRHLVNRQRALDCLETISTLEAKAAERAEFRKRHGGKSPMQVMEERGLKLKPVGAMDRKDPPDAS